MQNGIAKGVLCGCLIVFTIFIVGIFVDDSKPRWNRHDEHSQYEWLWKAGKKTRQLVVTESQLLGLAPMYTSYVEIIGVTDDTVVLKANGHIIAEVYRALYKEEIMQQRREKNRNK